MTDSCAVALDLRSVARHAARAESVEDFYKGKTVTLVIGYSVGGGYDLYGRLLARHIGKYIPGKPDDRAAEHDRRRQPARRAASSTPPRPRTAPFRHLRAHASRPRRCWRRQRAVRRHQVHLARQHHQRRQTCASPGTRRRSRPGTTCSSKPITMGGEGTGADPDIFALLYKNVFGAKIEARHRLSRHQRRSRSRWSAARSMACAGCPGARSRARHLQWLDGQEDQHPRCRPALKKEPELPRRAARRSTSPRPPSSCRSCKLVLASQEMARPFAAPPGIPADRKARADRGVRRDHEGSGLPRRGGEAERRRQSGQRGAREPDRRAARRRRLYRQRPKDDASPEGVAAGEPGRIRSPIPQHEPRAHEYVANASLRSQCMSR